LKRIRPIALLLLGLTLASVARAVELRPGDILLTDSRRDTVLRVDPVTGDRTLVSGSDRGTGPHFEYPLGMALHPDGRIFLADQNRRAIVVIDPATGDRTDFAAASVGTGTRLRSPKHLAFHPSGYFAVGDAGLDAVVRMDLEGRRTILTPRVVRGSPQLKNPIGVAFDAEGFLLLIDNNRRALFRVDPATGARDVRSSPSVGSGPQWLNPAGIALEASGHAVISDRDFGVWRVDPVSGARATVSSNEIGEGPDWLQPFSIGVEFDGNLLVIDRNQRALLRVDPKSGDRVVLSSETVGQGVVMLRPRHLTIVPGAPSRPPSPTTLAIGAAVLVATVGGLFVWRRKASPLRPE
jgi:streptogramin lyase